MNRSWSFVGVLALLTLSLVLLVGWGVGQAQEPQAGLEMTKSVEPSVIAPLELVVYSVTLSNTTDTTMTLSSLVDTLPDGFIYVDLANGSEWEERPDSSMPPEIKWQGPITVPMSDSLTIMYKVFVPNSIPLSAQPYTNKVEAKLGEQSYTAEADLMVAIGEGSVEKVATPDMVRSEEQVTFTVTFSNSGYVPLPVEVITDVLPDHMVFEGMTANSDVITEPNGITGTITWTGHFTIGSHAELVLEYQAVVTGVSGTLTLENQVSAQLGDGHLVADGAEVRVTDQPGVRYLPLVFNHWALARFSAAKTAEPTEAYGEAPGALITYRVVFTNEGTEAGSLAQIRDQLPAGFTFVKMMPGSQVTTDPSPSTGEIVWNGPFDVAGESTLTLIYQVRASTTPNIYVNSVTATAEKGFAPEAPATASVEILPLTLLEESFDKNASRWTPFLNNHRLHESQWWWEGGVGRSGSGAYNHSMYAWAKEEAHDGLSMYLQDNAMEWTDYLYEAWVYPVPDPYNNVQIALWFRGNYKESQVENQWVLAYYMNVIPTSNRVEFWQTQTPDDCILDTCDVFEWQYNYQNPVKLAEKRYDMGKQWLGEWHKLAVEVKDNHMKAYVDGELALEFTDTEGTIIESGAVGLACYKASLIRWDDIKVTPIR